MKLEKIVGLQPNHDGHEVVFLTDDQVKINQLIDASNRQEGAIKVIAGVLSHKDLIQSFPNLKEEINSLLEGKDSNVRT
jgi:hypothetical protein